MLSSNSLLALRWKDKKDVYMLRTKHWNIDLVETGKRKKKDDDFDKIIKPSCVIEYNTGMGGVDNQDQLLACFPVMRKCMVIKKWRFI